MGVTSVRHLSFCVPSVLNMGSVEVSYHARLYIPIRPGEFHWPVIPI